MSSVQILEDFLLMWPQNNKIKVIDNLKLESSDDLKFQHIKETKNTQQKADKLQ